MKPRWQIASGEPALAARLAGELRLPPLFVSCLLNRGYREADPINRFLDPRLATLSDPFLLPQMDVAVRRLIAARHTGEPFVIFGDYDVDGVTATALLTDFLRELGWNCAYYLPHRMEEGYGLSRKAVERCLALNPVRLILAVDCGSSAREVIDHLRARAVEVIVLDHHQVSSPAPEPVALVNPHRLQADDHLKDLCSAGLAFKLAHALLKKGRESGWAGAAEYDLRKHLELVALGTVADLVPLRGENRIFARLGLQRLSRTVRPGLKALMEVSGIRGAVGSWEAAFQLAPRLNAAGRLESAMDALELLLTRDRIRAQALAESLDIRNRERQSIEQRITEEVLRAVRSRFDPSKDFAIVEGHPDWHVGVVGIVASRVLREFHRPTLIVGGDGTDDWRGSGRSIEGFDLAAGLSGCSDLLVKHGGHAMAAGLTVTAARLPELRDRMNELARQALPESALQPTLRVDAEVTLSELTFDLLRTIQSIAPTGQGNQPVHFAARKLRPRGEPRPFGSTGQHLRFHVEDGEGAAQAVWWNCKTQEIPCEFDLAFVPELNEYNGTLGIQLKVLDLRATTS